MEILNNLQFTIYNLQRKIKKGFTLIELLVVISVFGIISAALVGIFLQTIKGGSKADAIAQVKEAGDSAMATIQRSLKNASSVNNCGSGIDYYLPVPGGTLKHSFGLSNGVINSDQFGALTNTNFTVTNFSFTCSGSLDKYVEFSFTIARNTTDQRQMATVDFQGSARLREY